MSLVPYGNRDGFIWFDGKMVDWRDAKVHFLTHALHYGSGVFEGIRAYNGVPFKLTEHNQRLINGSASMDMLCPYSVEQLNDACMACMEKNNLSDAYLRPLVWRGEEQMGVNAQDVTIHVAIAVWDWPSYYGAELRENGIGVKLSKWRRPSPDSAPVHTKATGLYTICTLAKHEAEAAGFNDALMLDYRGHVAELTSANLFIVKNGALYTPLADCFLNGITRRTVMQLARDNGITLHESTVTLEDVMDADECFCTGTAAEVTPIGRIDDKKLTVGPVTRLLREKYEALIHGK